MRLLHAGKRRRRCPRASPGSIRPGRWQWKDFRGKFVLVDFWTYCCINCMHILPELKQLEHAYPKNLVVVGVHSAKFDAEQDTANIGEAILRYKIEHPVINDAQHVLWDRFGVQAWPTVVLDRSRGLRGMGHERRNHLRAGGSRVASGGGLSIAGKKLLDERPLHFDALARNAAPTPLRFPGKIMADAAGGRLLVADSNHNRIVAVRG